MGRLSARLQMFTLVMALALGLGMVRPSMAADAAAPAVQASLLFVQGDVQVRAKGGEWQVAQKGRPLIVGDEVKVGPQSAAELSYDRANSRVSRLDKEGIVVIEEAGEEGVRIRLQQGRLFNLVAPLASGQHFIVKTPEAVASVRGTVFEGDHDVQTRESTFAVIDQGDAQEHQVVTQALDDRGEPVAGTERVINEGAQADVKDGRVAEPEPLTPERQQEAQQIMKEVEQRATEDAPTGNTSQNPAGGTPPPGGTPPTTLTGTPTTTTTGTAAPMTMAMAAGQKGPMTGPMGGAPMTGAPGTMMPGTQMAQGGPMMGGPAAPAPGMTGPMTGGANMGGPMMGPGSYGTGPMGGSMGTDAMKNGPMNEKNKEALADFLGVKTESLGSMRVNEVATLFEVRAMQEMQFAYTQAAAAGNTQAMDKLQGVFQEAIASAHVGSPTGDAMMAMATNGTAGGYYGPGPTAAGMTGPMMTPVMSLAGAATGPNMMSAPATMMMGGGEALMGMNSNSPGLMGGQNVFNGSAGFNSGPGSYGPNFGGNFYEPTNNPANNFNPIVNPNELTQSQQTATNNSLSVNEIFDHFTLASPQTLFPSPADATQQVLGKDTAVYRRSDNTFVERATNQVYLTSALDRFDSNNHGIYREFNTYNNSQFELVDRGVNPFDHFEKMTVRFGDFFYNGSDHFKARMTSSELYAEVLGASGNRRAKYTDSNHNPTRDWGLVPDATAASILILSEIHAMHQQPSLVPNDHGRVQEPFDHWQQMGDGYHAVYRKDDGTLNDLGTVTGHPEREPIDHYDLRADGEHTIHQHQDGSLHDHGVEGAIP